MRIERQLDGKIVAYHQGGKSQVKRRAEGTPSIHIPQRVQIVKKRVALKPEEDMIQKIGTGSISARI